MRISEIRRYPVKSMGGESLQSIDVDARGLAGDRWFAVVDATGKLGSGKNSRRFRRFDEIFEYHATVVDGDTQVADRPDRSLGHRASFFVRQRRVLAE